MNPPTMDPPAIDRPSTPPQQYYQLTRDQRLRIQLLKDLHWNHAAIAEHEHVSLRQVSWAVNHSHVTPQRHQRGVKPMLDHDQVQALIRFISASRVNRRMPYFQVAAVLDWGVGEYAIQHALEREGYKRHVGRVKPIISEKTRVARLA